MRKRAPGAHTHTHIYANTHTHYYLLPSELKQKHGETSPGGPKPCKNTKERALEARKHAKTQGTGHRGTTRIHAYTQTHTHTSIYCSRSFRGGCVFSRVRGGQNRPQTGSKSAAICDFSPGPRAGAEGGPLSLCSSNRFLLNTPSRVGGYSGRKRPSE